MVIGGETKLEEVLSEDVKRAFLDHTRRYLWGDLYNYAKDWRNKDQIKIMLFLFPLLEHPGIIEFRLVVEAKEYERFSLGRRVYVPHKRVGFVRKIPFAYYKFNSKGEALEQFVKEVAHIVEREASGEISVRLFEHDPRIGDAPPLKPSPLFDPPGVCRDPTSLVHTSEIIPEWVLCRLCGKKVYDPRWGGGNLLWVCEVCYNPPAVPLFGLSPTLRYK